MIKNKSQYEDVVIKMLTLIISEKELSQESFPECSSKDFMEILCQCINDEFIIGYNATERTCNGNPHIQKVGTPFVTFKGLSFMNSIEQARASEMAAIAKEQAEKAEKHSIYALLKSNKAYALSIISILVTILINADKIVHNLQKILSYLGLM